MIELIKYEQKSRTGQISKTTFALMKFLLHQEVNRLTGIISEYNELSATIQVRNFGRNYNYIWVFL